MAMRLKNGLSSESTSRSFQLLTVKNTAVNIGKIGCNNIDFVVQSSHSSENYIAYNKMLLFSLSRSGTDFV